MFTQVENCSILGFFCALVICEQKNLDIGYIDVVAVHKDYRNRGLAGLLLQSIESFYKSKNVIRLQLCVFSDNAKALRLYKKHGFVQVPELAQMSLIPKTLCTLL